MIELTAEEVHTHTGILIFKSIDMGSRVGLDTNYLLAFLKILPIFPTNLPKFLNFFPKLVWNYTVAIVILAHKLLGVLCWALKAQFSREILLQQIMAELKQSFSVLLPSSLSCCFALLLATN